MTTEDDGKAADTEEAIFNPGRGAIGNVDFKIL